MLKECKSVDSTRALPDRLLQGFSIVGDIRRSQRWPMLGKSQEVTPIENVLPRAWEIRKKIVCRANAAPVSDNLRAILDAAIEDVKLWERSCLKRKLAYRQIVILPDHRTFNVICLKDPYDAKAKFFVMIGHSFGLVSSVYNYNRRSSAINEILEKIFSLVAFNFYEGHDRLGVGSGSEGSYPLGREVRSEETPDHYETCDLGGHLQLGRIRSGDQRRKESRAQRPDRLDPEGRGARPRHGGKAQREAHVRGVSFGERSVEPSFELSQNDNIPKILEVIGRG